MLKIISGGQTGIDRMGLEVARELGLPTGGTAPKSYWTENGADPSLAAFGLKEHVERDYGPRTKQNVLDSDATVLYGNPDSPGSRTTIRYCKELKKQCLINPEFKELAAIINNFDIKVLNVADNRASKLSQEQLQAFRISFRNALEYYERNKC